MDTKQFKKLKNQIDKILSQAEDEAAKEGVAITSPEFQVLLAKLKEKLLSEWGITLEEYDAVETELEQNAQAKKDEIVQFLGDRAKSSKEIKEKTDGIVSDFSKKIQDLGESFGKEIDNTRKSVLTRKDVLNIVLPLIPKMPKHGDFDHPKFLKEIAALNLKINEVSGKIAGVGADKLRDDLSKLQTDMGGLADRVKNIKVPKDIVQQSVLEPSIQKILAAELNRILRTFSSQIYRNEQNIKDRVIRGGFYKLTVSATEPSNPEENDLWVDIS